MNEERTCAECKCYSKRKGFCPSSKYSVNKEVYGPTASECPSYRNAKESANWIRENQRRKREQLES